MPLAGLVVNRASRTPGRPALRRAGARGGGAARRGDERPTGPTGAGCCGCTPTGSRIVARETRLRRRFTAAHPDVPTAVVPALSTDVHDLDGLRLVGGLLSRQS